MCVHLAEEVVTPDWRGENTSHLVVVVYFRALTRFQEKTVCLPITFVFARFDIFFALTANHKTSRREFREAQGFFFTCFAAIVASSDADSTHQNKKRLASSNTLTSCCTSTVVYPRTTYSSLHATIVILVVVVSRWIALEK